MIYLNGITKSFNKQPVLKGINLEIERGEVVTILGPSGSGKTTLLRCLNFLEKPDSGIIQIGNVTGQFRKSNEKRNFITSKAICDGFSAL